MRLQTSNYRSDAHRLLTNLQNILALESAWDWSPRKCSPSALSSSSSSSATASSRNHLLEQSRDDVAAWLLELNHELGLNPETFVLSIYLLDRFLVIVKAHPKYLHCIAVSCLFLAMKCVEEDEAIPSTHDLVLITDCGCSVAEILRMERVILNKLEWDLQPLKSPLDFLHVLHSILLLKQTTLFSGKAMEDRDECFRMANRQLSSLTRKLFACLLRRGFVLEFRPSTLALALVSLELGLCTENWLAATVALQRLTGVDETDLIRCREVVSRIFVADNILTLMTSRKHNPQPHRLRPHPRPTPPPSPKQLALPPPPPPLHSTSFYHNVKIIGYESTMTGPRLLNREVIDDEDVHDAIKRLYAGDLLSP